MTPFIKNFKATTIMKAFVLQAMAATIVIFMAVTMKAKYDKYTDKHGQNVVNVQITWRSVVFTLLFTFATALLSYFMMFWVFGYGGGMLIQTPC
jgi:ABC-type spermidine/putrescine transport system permease subunit I